MEDHFCKIFSGASQTVITLPAQEMHAKPRDSESRRLQIGDNKAGESSEKRKITVTRDGLQCT